MQKFSYTRECPTSICNTNATTMFSFRKTSEKHCVHPAIQNKSRSYSFKCLNYNLAFPLLEMCIFAILFLLTHQSIQKLGGLKRRVRGEMALTFSTSAGDQFWSECWDKTECRCCIVFHTLIRFSLYCQLLLSHAAVIATRNVIVSMSFNIYVFEANCDANFCHYCSATSTDT